MIPCIGQVLDTIQHGFGYPTNSRIKAIQAYNEDARNGSYVGSYTNAISNMLGFECEALENEDHARIQLGYVIEVAIAPCEGIVDAKDIYAEATRRAKVFVEKNPWTFAKPDQEVKLDTEGKPKPKKGSKGERSYAVYCELVAKGASRKEIIEAFQDREVMGMTPHTKSGATTYFYNMRRKHEQEKG